MTSELLKVRNVDITFVDLDRIIYLIKNATKHFKQESKSLENMDFKTFSEIYEEKFALLEELEVHQGIISQKPDLIKNLDKSKIDYLKKTYKDFEREKKENIFQLEIAISANKTLVNIVKNFITKEIKHGATYLSNGKYFSDENLEEEMPPLNLNNII